MRKASIYFNKALNKYVYFDLKLKLVVLNKYLFKHMKVLKIQYY